MSSDNPVDPKVGYCKPPSHGRFKPGKSGNPYGRPSGVSNFATDVKNALRTRIAVNDRGKTRNISTQKAALMRLREKALKGDPRSLDRLLDLAIRYQPVAIAGPASAVSADDQTILDHYRERILSESVKAVASPSDVDNSHGEGE